MVLLVASVLCVGCVGEDIAIDPGGSADYVIDNQTSLTLNVTMKFVPQLGSGHAQYPAPIPAGSRLKFFHDSIIGVNPLPDSSFTGIELHDPATGALRYAQEPIQNGLWVSRVLGGNPAGYHLAEHTLTVTDEMLTR
jgi:hypothetical protein